MTSNVSSICDRIEAAIHNEDEIEDVFGALLAVFTFHMSLMTCSHCRKETARWLKRSIPDMLTRANRAAAARASEGEQQPTTCH